MKKTLYIIGIVAAIIALIIFNKKTSKSNVNNTYAEVKKGTFEIIITNSGELIAEKSIDIRGPELGIASNQGQNQGSNQGRGQGGGQGGGQRGGQGGGQGGGQRGSQIGGADMRATFLKIQDIVPEGSIVNKGDYIAQLDRTFYDNTLKDELTNLSTLQVNLEMKILDTAVVLNSLRDDIKNQRYIVGEATITLAQSKYESPTVIRQAEINLDKSQRILEQKIRSYTLSNAQILAQIKRQKLIISRRTRLVTDLQEYLAKFTITAPSSGMVIYKKERNGTKRKAGSNVNPFDLVIATLPDLSSMISKTFVNEIEISKVKPGQKAKIIVDAFPEKSFTGNVVSIANVGEKLPNSNEKMFEVLIRVDGSDPALRPTMTTGNEVIIKTYDNAVYIPTECVQTGPDSIPYVYEKKGNKQIVVLGESNEKNVIVEQGLEPGISIYLTPPEEPKKFKLVGENLISIIKERK